MKVLFMARLMRVACLLLCATLGTGQAMAADTSTQLNASVDMAQNLRNFTGVKVFITLMSGTSISGTVKSVSKEMLHLSELTGKEYFDSIIRIDHISAMEARRN